MADTLSTQDFQLLSLLPRTLETAQADASVMPENRADCESFRRSIRDRLKPYVQKKSVLDDGLLQRAINTIQAQETENGIAKSSIKSLLTENEALKAKNMALMEALEPFAWLAEILPDEYVEVTKRFEWLEPLRTQTSSGGIHYEYDRQLNGIPFFRAKEALALLPADALELEQKREAVVQAAKDWAKNQHSGCKGDNLECAVEALEEYKI